MDIIVDGHKACHVFVAPERAETRAKVIGRRAYSNTAASTAVTNTVSETAFDTSYSIPPNVLQPGDVLLVAGMDIPNIKNVKIGLQTLRLLNTPMEKLRLVLNRANSKVKLDVGEVEPPREHLRRMPHHVHRAARGVDREQGALDEVVRPVQGRVRHQAEVDVVPAQPVHDRSARRLATIGLVVGKRDVVVAHRPERCRRPW